MDLKQLPDDHPLKKLSPDKFVQPSKPSKFAPKLERDERCAVLALVRAGVDMYVVATAFGVDRRTVGHIANKQSIHYKDVRREYENLGPIDFTTQYVTPEVVERVEAAKVDPLSKVRDPAAAVQARTALDGRPNARAKGMAGIHVVKPDQCKHSHRIEIVYRSADEATETPEGWHYRDLDGSTPEMWFHSGEESLLTSQNCKRMAEANLTDD